MTNVANETIELDFNAAVERSAKALGAELWGLNKRLIRGVWHLEVFIESAQGVTADLCLSVGKQIYAVLGVEGFSQDAIQLEVSSPGVNRKFFSVKQCAAYTNSLIACHFSKDEIIKGKLLAVDGDQVSVLIKNKSVLNAEFSEVETISLISESHDE